MSQEYYKTKESVKEYIRLASGVDGNELINRLKEFLPADSTVLEIGSGPGTDWKLLCKDYKVTGSDSSLEFLSHLTSSHPTGKFIELDAVSLSVNEQYDGIYSNKVLHHLKDNELIDSIERQNEILNSGGIVCHSFWKGKGSEIFKGLFVNYHSELLLRDFFEKYFEILVLENYAEFDEDDSIILIAKKRL